MSALKTMEIIWDPAREESLRRDVGDAIGNSAIRPGHDRFDAVFLLRNEDLSIAESVFSRDFEGHQEETARRVPGLVSDALAAANLPEPPSSLQAHTTFLRFLAERQKRFVLVGVTVDRPTSEWIPLITGVDLLVDGKYYKCTYLEASASGPSGRSSLVETEIKRRLLREVAFWKWGSPRLRSLVDRIEDRGLLDRAGAPGGIPETSVISAELRSLVEHS